MTGMNIMVEGPLYQQSSVCEPVFRELQSWFGIEAAVQNYLQEIDHLPTFVARFEEDVVGFFTVKHHFPRSAEAYVLGVKPAYQRCGAGRALLQAAEAYLCSLGVDYLQVKTLGPSHPDPDYARTRAFYEAVSFVPLEELPQLWGAENPCLLMVKRVGQNRP